MALPEIPNAVFGCAAATGPARAVIMSIDSDAFASYEDYKPHVAKMTRELPFESAPSLAVVAPMPRLGTYRISAVQQN